MKARYIESTDPLEIAGVRLASAAAGIRRAGREDLALVELASGTETAAVFTENRFCAAPVVVARQHIEAVRPRFLLFNSGNANAGTGQGGIDDAHLLIDEVASRTGCSSNEVLPFSTGVIGERLDTGKITSRLTELVDGLAADHWVTAAQAIMTTDTVAKHFSVEIDIDDTRYRVTGFAKGSGMIHPNMATMLAFVATDAALSADYLKQMLSDCVNESFNRITVDGDTSTNDACVLSATGHVSGGEPISPEHPHWQPLLEGMRRVFVYLAKAIVRDGEGATKFVEIVVNSPNEEDSLAIATTVAQSPLVKTALFASDPNWGRILAAVGRAPVPRMPVHDVAIWLDEYQIVQNGALIAGYDESIAAAVMAKTDIRITISVGSADVPVRIWTCDFSYDYVRINAEYRS